LSWAGNFRKIRERCGHCFAAYGLDLIGGWYSSHLLIRDAAAEIDALQSHLALLEQMGSGVFIAAECSNSIHGIRTRPLREQPTVVRLGSLWRTADEGCEYVATRVCASAYHHHLGTVVQTAEDIDAFIAHTDGSVGFVVEYRPCGPVRNPERYAH